MRITHLELGNWRNFEHVDIDVGARLFVLGPNASGKSNLLDAIRFLQELSIDGGGFQRAIQDRGGLARIRNLAARSFNKGQVTLSVCLGDSEAPNQWVYALTFTAEPSGRRRPIVVRETVHADGRLVLERPNDEDRADRERLTQTAIEQVAANRDFRVVHGFFSSVLYLHLVPQLLRAPERGGVPSHDGCDP